ncbi:hypothetical protein ACKU3Z_029505 [Pseudomonas aeruginosa]|nr:hypothetical protein [Pseudomonas aeruginosa]
MKRSSSFKSEMLGFYFSINGLRIPADGDIPEEQSRAADAINHRAYDLLEQSLPKSSIWIKQDEHEPEITYTPYEVCEESLEMEEFEGQAAFNFWIFSHHRIDEATAAALQAEVLQHYTRAAAELGGTAQFLRLESVVTEEVATTTEIDLQQQSQQS